MDRRSRIEEALLLGERTIPQYLEYESPSIHVTEWLRYACIPVYEQERAAKDPKLASSMEKALSLISGAVSFRVGFMVLPLVWNEEGFPVFPFEQRSEKLRKNLLGCDRAVLFAATIGSGIDRLIRRFEKADPQMGLLLQGLGAERVESLCDAFDEEVRRSVRNTERRPGSAIRRDTVIFLSRSRDSSCHFWMQKEGSASRSPIPA